MIVIVRQKPRQFCLCLSDLEFNLFVILVICQFLLFIPSIHLFLYLGLHFQHFHIQIDYHGRLIVD